jgi:hypothetical protein
MTLDAASQKRLHIPLSRPIEQLMEARVIGIKATVLRRQEGGDATHDLCGICQQGCIPILLGQRRQLE